MKPTGFRPSWYDRRLPYWLRGLVVLAAAFGALLPAKSVLDGHRSTVAYRQAPVCADDGCVQAAAGEVRDRDTGERCTSTATSAGGASGGESCSTSYSLRIVWPGGSQWLEVGPEAYAEARTGERAQLRIWKGQVVGLDVLGHSRAYPPASQTDLGPPLILVWLAFGVAGWAVLSGRAVTLLPLGFAGLMGSIVIQMVGADIFMWSPPVFFGALAALAGGVGLAVRAVFRS
ncbi:hypothetical protein [Streptomyces sp. G-G2]|uniref:hypothetical protein n=1 Tax=Streptomyces sp. G-G2 TaxID=3046201 RepID=UPI0024B8E204|nr:hypothetical protein [Streptomyces sp. G-G2]MDJ0385960.1 hypothetical protein [Streptomyces sp. G-G2]